MVQDINRTCRDYNCGELFGGVVNSKLQVTEFLKSTLKDVAHTAGLAMAENYTN
jgi:hypothetical protein